MEEVTAYGSRPMTSRAAASEREAAQKHLPHALYAGGPECPCPGIGSVYHHWFNEGRTRGLQDALERPDILAVLAAHPTPPPPLDARVESPERLTAVIKEADGDNPEWARGARFVLGWVAGPSLPELQAAFDAVRDRSPVATPSPFNPYRAGTQFYDAFEEGAAATRGEYGAATPSPDAGEPPVAAHYWSGSGGVADGGNIPVERELAYAYRDDLQKLIRIADAARGYVRHIEAPARTHEDGDGCYHALEDAVGLPRAALSPESGT